MNRYKTKLQYFWMFYKLPLLAVLLMLAGTAHFIHASFTEKETALHVTLADSHFPGKEERLEEDFASRAGIDAGRYGVAVDTELLFSDAAAGNYAVTSLSRFYADVGRESLDVCGMLEKDFEKFVRADCFLDLRGYLTQEQTEALSGMLYLSGERILGIRTQGLPRLLEYGCYAPGGEPGVLGVVYNTKHVENAVKYLLYAADL